MSLVSAGLGIGFAPEWTEGLPNRAFKLKTVWGIDFRIGLGVAWNKEDPPPRAMTSSILHDPWHGRREDGGRRVAHFASNII
ncbi:hypothetical protein AJ87_37485 [Rhizobium yanglingense]|nr:hypothetical protein AJ87_37485 [Rhizobium yanglingense]